MANPQTERELQEGKPWLVDNDNCSAAIAKLGIQPSEVQLIARDDRPNVLSLEDIQEISNQTTTENCGITARFVDSFLKPCDTSTDQKRLQIITAHKSFCLKRFYGYLDNETIKTLPETITSLGLAINNAADAEAVSSLKPWKNLSNFNVSVSSAVNIADLKPLSLSAKGPVFFMTFPNLADEWVKKVRPAIDALAPDIEVIKTLTFPESQMTAEGAERLAFTLRGLNILWIHITPCETKQLQQKEKKSIEEKLKTVTSHVVWNVDWLYMYREH